MNAHKNIVAFISLSFIIFGIIAGIDACSKMNHNKTAEENEQYIALKYRIKNSKEYVTYYRLGGGEQAEYIRREKIYDSNGLRTKEIVHSPEDSSIENITLHTYDSFGNLVFRKAVKTDSSSLFSEKRIYDKNNNKTESYFYNADGSVLYHKTFVYDKEGRLLKSQIVHDGQLKSKYTYEYNGMNMTESDDFDSTGKFLSKWLYNYDAHDNQIEAVQYNSKNILQQKTTSEYNSMDFKTKETNYFGTELRDFFIYEYNWKNLLSVRTEYASNSKITAKYRYKYEFYK